MTTSSFSCTINSTGISAPPFSTILSNLQTNYYSIFGTDSYLGNDSQDGQLLAIFAQAISDNNSACINTYNAYSPTYAQGAGLSSVVKINGIRRLAATNSTVPVILTGTVGATITNGVVQDTSYNLWNLPTTVIIPVGNTITVLATAQQPGQITATPYTLITIYTPTFGWTSVTNSASASLGSNIETDATLRQRQTTSTTYSALAIIEAIISDVANLTGVTDSVIYENTTSVTDSNGCPGHSIYVVVNGGDPIQIANALASRKPPGCGTFGTTSETLVVGGTTVTYNFFYATIYNVQATITLHALNGYTAAQGVAAQTALYNYINELTVGESAYITSGISACAPTYPNPTYHLLSVTYGVNGGAQAATDISIPFNGLTNITLANVSLVLA